MPEPNNVTPDPRADQITDWLREKPDERSLTVVAEGARYGNLKVTLRDESIPCELTGTGWTLAVAFKRAIKDHPEAPRI